MNPFSVIFFHLFVFLAGGMCFINLSGLVAHAEPYNYSWAGVGVAIIMGIIGAVMTHTETTDKYHRIYKR